MLLMLLFIVTLLLFIPVLVVDADEGAAEGEDFAKSDEDGVMDLCQWWADEARYEQCAPKRAHCNSGDELEVFHRIWKLDRFTIRPFLSRIRSNDFFVTLAE